MREHERESARGDAFEALLAQSVDELPPEEIVADVTPWRRAMERVLFGLALCMVILNFWCLNYLLPAIGTVLLLLGFRALRRRKATRFFYQPCGASYTLRSAAFLHICSKNCGKPRGFCAQRVYHRVETGRGGRRRGRARTGYDRAAAAA